ncbi:MAG: arylesterase [Panacibacter sp.]
MQKKATTQLLVIVLLFMGCTNNQSATGPSVMDSVKEKETTVSQNLKNIVFLGNSITAGYGVGESGAFPALIQGRIDSLKLPYKVINAGISGETSADGLSRINWVLKQPVDVLVLELGGNDGLRGIPLSGTFENLQAISDTVKKKYQDATIIMAGMEIPPNMGKKYTDEFRALYGQLAKKNHTLLIPFLLEGVGGVPELNQSDGIHPNVQGHKIVANNVWAVLKNVLK